MMVFVVVKMTLRPALPFLLCRSFGPKQASMRTSRTAAVSANCGRRTATTVYDEPLSNSPTQLKKFEHRRADKARGFWQIQGVLTSLPVQNDETRPYIPSPASTPFVKSSKPKAPKPLDSSPVCRKESKSKFSSAWSPSPKL